MERGWVKLHRKFLDWEWYNEIDVKVVFIHLLISANHKPKKWKGISVNSGQVLTGRKKLAQDLRMSEQRIRTSLNRLKSTSEITIKTTNKFSIVTICNWDSYQSGNLTTNQQANQQANQQLTNNQPTTNQQLTTNKNDKNVKNDKNDKKEERDVEKSKKKTSLSMRTSNSSISNPIASQNNEAKYPDVEEWYNFALSYAKEFFSFAIDPDKVKGILYNDYEYFDSIGWITGKGKKQHRITEWKKTCQSCVRRANSKLRDYTQKNNKGYNAYHGYGKTEPDKKTYDKGYIVSHLDLDKKDRKMGKMLGVDGNWYYKKDGKWIKDEKQNA